MVSHSQEQPRSQSLEKPSISWIFRIWRHLTFLAIAKDPTKDLWDWKNLPFPGFWGLWHLLWPHPPQPDHSAPALHQEAIGDYPIPISRFGSRDFTAGRQKFWNLGAKGMEKIVPEILRSQKENHRREGRDSSRNSWRCQEMSAFPFPSCFPSQFPPSGSRFPNRHQSGNDQPGNPGFFRAFHSLKVSRAHPAPGLGAGKDLPRFSFPTPWNDDFCSKFHSRSQTPLSDGEKTPGCVFILDKTSGRAGIQHLQGNSWKTSGSWRNSRILSPALQGNKRNPCGIPSSD